MDGNDDTAGHCMRGTRYGQVIPWTGALLKYGGVGHKLLSASHEQVGDPVR